MKQNLLAALLLAALSASVQGAALEETGRRIVEDFSEAVVTVQIVVQQGISFGGQERTVQEQKSETTGTVIDPSGLTVVSLTTVDPSAMVDRLMRGGDGMSSDFNFDVNLTDARLLMPDGREVPATMVLRDRDLDLAFLRPIAPQAKPFVYIDLSEARDADLLDSVFVVSRMGRVGARQPAISIDRIHAHVKRPRPFYVLDQSAAAVTKLGSPIFAENGTPIGVLVLRSVATPGGGGMSSMFGGLDAMGMLPIVQPAVDILETAEQVPPADETEPETMPAGSDEDQEDEDQEDEEHEHEEHEHDDYEDQEHKDEEQGMQE